jgi:hypothetical protein
MTPAGFPHSDTPGSQLGCQLPRAYRRLPRPSSALDAKASTMCPSQLVSQTLNKNHTRHTPHHQHTTTTHKVTAAPRQQGNFLQKIDNTHHPHPHKRGTRHRVVARCSRPLSTSQTPHPPTPPPTRTPAARGRRHRRDQPQPSRTPPEDLTGLIPQGPTACQNQLPHPHPQVPHPHPDHQPRPEEKGRTEKARRQGAGVRR